MIDIILNFFREFFSGIFGFFKAIFTYVSDIIDWLAKLIKDFWLSVYDFVVDLIPNLVIILTDFLTYLFTDLLASACDYCFGGWDLVINNNLRLLVAIPDSLGSSLIYILSQCGFDDALRRLSCGLIMWCVLRIISLIRG